MILPPKHRNPETGKLEGKHTMIVGCTGFGKTYFVSAAQEERKYVVVHDGKRTFREKAWIQKQKEEWTLVETLNESMKVKTNKICYSPNRRELHNAEIQNEFFEWCLLRGNCTVVIDEMTLVAPDKRTIPPALEDSYATGREAGLEIWALTQQPVYVPNICFTQSRSFVIFYCALDTHREKISSFVPIEPEQIEALNAREFYLYEDTWQNVKGPYYYDSNADEITLLEKGINASTSTGTTIPGVGVSSSATAQKSASVV